MMEKNIGKEETQTMHKNTCICSSMQGLFIPNRQLSLVVAGTMAFMCVTFMGGIFWGKKRAVEELNATIDQGIFADQIYTSVCTLYEQDNTQEVNTESKQDTTVAVDTPSPSPLVNQAIQEKTAAAVHEDRYYAQLAGFAQESYAYSFAKRLANKDIKVHIDKRTSKTSKGSPRIWYQVVTKPYINKDELVQLVDRISKEEKLKDVRIVSC